MIRSNLFNGNFSKHGPAALFFSCILILGFFIADDYGIPMDEPTQDQLAGDAYAYVFSNEPWPSNPEWMFMGPAFELPVFILQNIFSDESIASKVFIRHFAIFVMFWFGLIAFYVLAMKLFFDSTIALALTAALALSPRIFADSFYNSKDIPALSAFIIAMCTLEMYMAKRTHRRLLLHAVACGFAVAVRPMALLAPALSALRMLFSSAIHRRAATVACFGILVALSTIAFWPYFWENPLSHFFRALSYSSTHFTGSSFFYFGQLRTESAWGYWFVWLLITTPLLLTALCVTGMFCDLHTLRRNMSDRFHPLLSILWFGVPIMAAELLRSGQFDGWRHLYFIYPALLLFAGSLLVRLKLRSQFAYRSAFALLAGQTALCAVWIGMNHPHQFAYFSVPSLVGRNFELDYWNLSSRRLLDRIDREDPRPVLRIHSPAPITHVTASSLYRPYRFVQAQSEELSDYIIDTFRSTNYEPTFHVRHPTFAQIRIDDIEIAAAYFGPLTIKAIDEAKRIRAEAH